MTSPPVSATAQIRRLRGVVWEWRAEAPPEAHAQPGMGVIAQEVERVFPELVETFPDGHKEVEYDGLVPPLVVAIGELVERLDALSATGDDRREASSISTPNDDATERLARAAVRAAGTALDPDEVEKLYPQLIYLDEDGNREIAYHGLIGPLIEAVKELDRRLTVLESTTDD